jgi:urea transporter
VLRVDGRLGDCPDDRDQRGGRNEDLTCPSLVALRRIDQAQLHQDGLSDLAALVRDLWCRLTDGAGRLYGCVLNQTILRSLAVYLTVQLA